ncbi:hypothetical protein IWX63_002975 [Arthrobacter sp. CAN_A2]
MRGYGLRQERRNILAVVYVIDRALQGTAMFHVKLHSEHG